MDNEMPLLWVEWIDFIDSISVRSVGWCIGETDEWLSLVAQRAEPHKLACMRHMNIPKVAITGRWEIVLK